MGSWRKVKLKDICDVIQYGYTASAKTEKVGPKFLRITDIVNPLIIWDTVPYCKISKQKEENYILNQGDIVIARTGATTGYAKHLKNPPEAAVFASYLVRLKLKSNVNSGFVGLIIESNYYKDFIKCHIGGAAQPNANAKILTSFSMLLPPLPVQRRIASILGAYDDLIENNTRRIRLLEQMAQRIYRQWFVDFKFPDHENAKFIDSPLGKIPQGWEVKTLGDISEVIPGFAFKSRDWIINGVQVIKIKNIMHDNSVKLDTADCVPLSLFDKLSKYRLLTGDIVVAMTGATAGKTGRIRTKKGLMLNQRVAKLDAKKGFKEYVWSLVSQQSTQDSFFKLADGAAQPNMSGKQLENFKVVVPLNYVLSEFNYITNQIYNNMDSLYFIIQNLRRTRDLLLPKLINGEIEV